MVLSVRQSLMALSLLGNALATQPWLADTLVGRDLDIRQTPDTSKCDPNGYSSQNGLNFTIYCEQNNPQNDAQKSFKSPSFQDCMEHCSRFWNDQVGEGCFGVSWVEASSDCWLRNSSTSTKSLESRPGHYSALLADGQMKGYDTTCPGADASVHELSGIDGLGYTLNCNKVVGGFDTCFSGFPKPCLEKPYLGFFHTKTLEECLRICVDQHPLCKAVSWNPGLEIGWANCWPKAGYSDTALTTPASKLGVLHTATITRIDPVDRNCPSAKTYTSKDANKKFDIHCGQVSTAPNITSIHTQNVTACMDACAKSDQKCISVVFDSGLSGGFKNCYFQNTTNTMSEIPSGMFATLSSSTGTPSANDNSNNNNNNNGGSTGSSQSNSSTTSSSKAWIAGVVIGVLALIALIAFAIFWWRRRKTQTTADEPVEKDGHDLLAYGAAPAYTPSPHEDYYHPQAQQASSVHSAHDMPPVELSGQSHQPRELSGTEKYAYREKASVQELP